MPVTKTTRTKIIRSAWRLFHERGYASTSLQQLATAAGLGKAGLLHHFGSKAGVLEAVLEYAQSWYESRVLAVVDEPGPVADRLGRLLARQAELTQLNGGAGCFYGNLMLELGEGSAFGEQLQQFHEAWQAAVRRLLGERYPAAEADERAYRLFIDYQGSVMLFKLRGDTHHLDRFLERTLSGLDQPISLPQ